MLLTTHSKIVAGSTRLTALFDCYINAAADQYLGETSVEPSDGADVEECVCGKCVVCVCVPGYGMPSY